MKHKKWNLGEVEEAVKAGATKRDIASNFPNAFKRHGKEIHYMRYRYGLQRDKKTHVLVIYGKCEEKDIDWLYETYPNAYHKESGKLWHHYDAHDVVVWKEFNPKKTCVSLMRRLMESYSFHVPTRHGRESFLSKTLVIVCDVHPEEWYTFDNDSLKRSFMCRIDEIKSWDDIARIKV